MIVHIYERFCKWNMNITNENEEIVELCFRKISCLSILLSIDY